MDTIAPTAHAMNTHYAGSCLCCAVRFEVEGEFERFYLCHCSYCRKDTGSAHAANRFSATARLRWTAGQDKTTLFNLPGTCHRNGEILAGELPRKQFRPVQAWIELHRDELLADSAFALAEETPHKIEPL